MLIGMFEDARLIVIHPGLNTDGKGRQPHGEDTELVRRPGNLVICSAEKVSLHQHVLMFHEFDTLGSFHYCRRGRQKIVFQQSR